MNQSFPSGSRIPGFAAWAMVLLAIAHLGWLQTRPESGLRTLLARRANPAAALAPFQEYDCFAAQSGPGNVFVKIVGCTRPDPAAETRQSFSDYRNYMLSVWWIRTSYSLYPRRAFLAPPDVVVNGGWDMMGLQFVPDAAWLQAHDVGTILTVGFDADGRTLPAHWEPVAAVTTKKGDD